MIENDSLSLLISRINGISAEWAHRHGINPYQMKPLYALYLNPSITQKEICACCALPKQTVSNAVRSLKNSGYIELEESEEDRREKHIILTNSGKEYLERTIAPVVDLENRVISQIGVKTYSAILSSLNKYADALEQEAAK